MSESLALQKAIVATLKADPTVASLVNSRVYDSVPLPPQLVLPYISLGQDSIEVDRAECYNGTIHSVQIDAWSQDVGFPEVKRISSAVRRALAYQPLDLTADGYRLVDIALETDLILRDPDGVTSHAVLTFRAMTEPV